MGPGRFEAASDDFTEQAIADHYAGKTVYESSMRRVPVVSGYLLTLDARAAPSKGLRNKRTSPPTAASRAVVSA